jgi:YidC/Oxa1 family membrane protein insertase
LATLVFSSDGASLDRLIFKRPIDSSVKFLTTVYPVAETEKEQRCFLVGLNEKTPYYYTLTDRQETDEVVQLEYQYESPKKDIRLHKKYMIFKKTHKIILTLMIDSVDMVEPRIFYSSPQMPELKGNDTISGLTANAKGKIASIYKNKIDARSGWFLPTLFGAGNKYFIHAMVDDKQQFTQRAYYQSIGNEKLISVLEGTTGQGVRSWDLVFYFGPKEEESMILVDRRLEQTLSYSGFLAPVARFLLRLLKLLYKYLHNYGLAIIVLTVGIRLLLLPFTVNAEKGMKKRDAFQKKLEYIRQRYKHDKESFAREQAELIKNHGVPGLGSCLPMLLQLPLFFALSRILSSSIELYKAPFGFWITDLSAKDPYYVLPGLVALSMLLTAGTADKKQRLMLVALAFVFGAFTSSFSAGLALYILIGTLVNLLQTVIRKGHFFSD